MSAAFRYIDFLIIRLLFVLCVACLAAKNVILAEHNLQFKNRKILIS